MLVCVFAPIINILLFPNAMKNVKMMAVSMMVIILLIQLMQTNTIVFLSTEILLMILLLNCALIFANIFSI